ncbi:MAG: hypothetical protein KAS29_03705 [Bacteroidales bacterium]|nr:hypothetical protein [Bacteroidales bacterium]
MDENLNFLEKICGDGYMPVSFLKMLPYLATEIEKNLREEGRLKGEPGFFDYDFHERSMNDFHDYVSDVFYKWINSPKGFSITAKWASNYFAVYLFYCETHEGIQHLSCSLKTHVSEANRYIIKTLKKLSIKFKSGNYTLKNDNELDKYRISIEKEHQLAVECISRIIEKVELYSLTKEVFRI